MTQVKTEWKKQLTGLLLEKDAILNDLKSSEQNLSSLTERQKQTNADKKKQLSVIEELKAQIDSIKNARKQSEVERLQRELDSLKALEN